MKKAILLTPEFLKSKLWTDEKYSRPQAFIELVNMANEKTTTKPYNFKLKTFRRGCVYKSNSALAGIFKWSNTKVNTYINELAERGLIRVVGRGISREIEILNYSEFINEDSVKKEYFRIPDKISDDSNGNEDWFNEL